MCQDVGNVLHLRLIEHSTLTLVVMSQHPSAVFFSRRMMLLSKAGLREVAPLGPEHLGNVRKTQHRALLQDHPLMGLFQILSIGPAPRGNPTQVSLNTCKELQWNENMTSLLLV